jgi:hypothetical protein
MNRIRLLKVAEAPTAGTGLFGFTAGADSIAFPAFAADAEASAIRTRALGATGRESAFSSGGEVFFAADDFFRALRLGEIFLPSTGGGAGAFPAGGLAGDET